MRGDWVSFISIVAITGIFPACDPSKTDLSAPVPFSVEGDHVKINAASRFSKRLERTQAQAVPGEARALRAVGQMIALANPSGELSGPRISWVELDPRLTKEAGLALNRETSAAVGEAFGIAILPVNYLAQVHTGERIQIARYGLRKAVTKGSVVSIRPNPKEPDLAQIIFAVAQGQDWYPGTNCEIEFPLIKSHPVRVSKNALLHEAYSDFVFAETRPGELKVKHVTVVGETLDDVYVLGDLAVGDRLIGSGAILLKPLVQIHLNSGKVEGRHVTP